MHEDDKIKYKEEIIKKAMSLLSSKDKLDEAELMLLNLEKEFPEDLIIKQNLSVILHQNGKSDEGIEKLKQAVKIDPEEFSNYHNIGLIYQKKKQFREAKAFFHKAVEVDREKAHICLTLLGQIYFNEGDMVNSLKAYQGVIEINGEDAFNANLGKGLCLSRLGYKKEAKQCLEKVVKLKPNDVHTREALAFLYLDIGMHREGLDINKELIGDIIFDTSKKEINII